MSSLVKIGLSLRWAKYLSCGHFDKQHCLNESEMDVTSSKHWLTPCPSFLFVFIWARSQVRLPLKMDPFPISPLYLPPSLFCQLYLQNEPRMSGKRWKGGAFGVRKRKMERGEILIVTGQSYWEPDDDPTASLLRCGDEVMGWWWHQEMEGRRRRGRWRANAYRLWPLGSETLLFWQGWVERPLKAWGSSSDLTTISPLTKLVGVCLDKWTWHPPVMRSPCRLHYSTEHRLLQSRVRLWGFVCFHLLPTGVLMSTSVTLRVKDQAFYQMTVPFAVY